MPKFDSIINGFVPGDHLFIERAAINVGVALSKAWFTVKTDPADVDPGLFQKEVTTTYVVDEGQVGAYTTHNNTMTAVVAPAAALQIPITTALPISLPKDLEIVFATGHVAKLSERIPKLSTILKVFPLEVDIPGSTAFSLNYSLCQFELTPAQTLLIATAAPGNHFDFQVKTTGNRIYTPEMGRIYGVAPQITRDAT